MYFGIKSRFVRVASKMTFHVVTAMSNVIIITMYIIRYNADGSVRIDDEWLSTRSEFNPEWSASDAWQHG